jgi:hypothetical protein
MTKNCTSSGRGLIFTLTLLCLAPAMAAPKAPYLLKDAPTLTHTLNNFTQEYNETYPERYIPPYKEIKQLNKNSAVFFASKISNVLYSSVVLDSQTQKIRTLQLTYLPPKVSLTEANPADTLPQSSAIGALISPLSNEAILIDGSAIIIGNSDTIAVDYMATLFQWFNPAFSKESCEKEVNRLLEFSKDQPLYQETINNLRYIVVHRGEKGITLAVEPIKQTEFDE